MQLFSDDTGKVAFFRYWNYWQNDQNVKGKILDFTWTSYFLYKLNKEYSVYIQDALVPTYCFFENVL